MITRPGNWDNIQAIGGDFETLPPGGYVCAILKAEVKNSASGYQYLDLTIDIAEGEYANHFRRDFDGQSGPEPRWRGHMRQGTPTGDATRDGFFKALVTAIENSNPGYAWDWNEQSLVGKRVGIIFREEEYEYNGRTGTRISAFRATDVMKIHDGNFTVPPKKELPGKPQTLPAGFESIGDQDIPF